MTGCVVQQEVEGTHPGEEEGAGSKGGDREGKKKACGGRKSPEYRQKAAVKRGPEEARARSGALDCSGMKNLSLRTQSDLGICNWAAGRKKSRRLHQGDLGRMEGKKGGLFQGTRTTEGVIKKSCRTVEKGFTMLSIDYLLSSIKKGGGFL